MSESFPEATNNTEQPVTPAEPTSTAVAGPLLPADTSVAAPVDPITGNGYTNTSNGNQVAVLSTIDYSTNTIIYNYQLNSTTQEYSSITHNYNMSTSNSGSIPATAANPGGTLSGSPGNTSLQRNGLHLRFDSPDYFRKKGIRRVDRIMGFNGSNGDKLELSRRVFKGIDDLEFKSVSSGKQLRRASKTDADIIYDESANRLYFNANAQDKGFGDKGGLFAIFEGEPLITADQFILI